MAARERWDREYYERDGPEDRYQRAPPPPGRYRDQSEGRFREPSEGRYRDSSVASRSVRDPYDDYYAQQPPRRAYDDDHPPPRDRRYHDEDRYGGVPPPRRSADRQSFPLEREREPYREPGQARRPPTLLRRQSSLDTYDRRPLKFLDERDEYLAPVRREDVLYRQNHAGGADPLPRSRQLAPPTERRTYGDISTPSHFDLDDGRHHERSRLDDILRSPDLVREQELVRTTRHRKRDQSRDTFLSRDSHTTRGRRRQRSDSVSSDGSSRSSSSSGGTTVRSEYPKKGKTKIPQKLVSIRALIDLGYPFIEQGNAVIVQRALGQEQIDEVLKLSEEYKKDELKLVSNRSQAGTVIEEERRQEIYTVPVPTLPPARIPSPIVAAPPPPPSVVEPPPAPAPVIVNVTAPAPPPPAPAPAPAPAPTVVEVVAPPPPPPAATVVEVAPPLTAPVTAPTPIIVDAAPMPHTTEIVHQRHTEVVRDYSPTRSYTAYTRAASPPPLSPDYGYPYYHNPRYGHAHGHYYEEEIVPRDAVARRPRSPSRSRREIRAEIRALEGELKGRRRAKSTSADMVRAERTPEGGVVLYEEKVERVQEGYRGARIERDKKGRMSISVPKYQ